MAGLVSYRNADREIEQALVALKKGAQLLQYGRKGKPKFCPFRLSSIRLVTRVADGVSVPDESSLIWISSSGERSLKLASISRIIPGQRTPVFERCLCPEKDYLSFSLIYNGGKNSLDLICKDKVEAEVWIAGLKALIASGQGGRSKIDGWNDGGFYLDDGSDLTSNSESDSSNCATRDLSSSEVSADLNHNISPKRFRPENSGQSERLNVASSHSNMQVKGYGSDAFRVSVSSAPSTSSHGSAPDDYEALGDVYIWGEVISDNVVKVGADKNTNYVTLREDVPLPMPLESNVVLDIRHIDCGVRHSALVTRQGEVFTWGEESGGRLGHGVRKNIIRPRIVESLAATSVDFVACGEFHTCAVTMAGELYTWGDGTHYAGLLGHGSDVSHWIPKRVSGALEGLQIASVTCGPWHTALITSMGQLFTFGDGTFGVLGHGDRENVSYPREVESLSGLRTIAVACGVWHTAAIVEVIVTQSSSSFSSGKLFTWGDGDKNRLGHGDKDPRLKPTCVPALIDYNFHKISCGHSLTVGLTTSGQVFTMGSPVYGQLGNPRADGKLPCLVEDKLVGEAIEEVACGAYHVAVLTRRNEVYTWGKGANGRLGHGDVEDRKMPTLVEGLKERDVKYISCGSNHMAAICLHKWVSGAEQSQCSACRQAFGFTRKRHNCYNCGLVHCHSCSSKKALRAALAPSPAKGYRVCDSCYTKLNKVFEASNNDRRNAIPRLSGVNKDKLEKRELKVSDSVPSNMDLIKQLDSKAAKQGRKAADTFSLVRSSQAPSLVQLRGVVLATTVDLQRSAPKPVLPAYGVNSRSVSPLSKRSLPRSATPIPTASGLSFAQCVSDSLKRTNELLNHEVSSLRAQVESLRQRYELQELELQRSMKKTQEALTLAADESAKSKAAKEVIKSLTAQLKDMAERLPAGVYETGKAIPAYPHNGSEPGIHYLDTNGQRYFRSDSISSFLLASPSAIDSAARGGSQGMANSPQELPETSEINLEQELKLLLPNRIEGHKDFRFQDGGKVQASLREKLEGQSEPSRCNESSDRSGNSTLPTNGNQVEEEWIEQFEPGVYITLVALQDGVRDVKRVRFSRRRFEERQAENWWAENREKVYKKYNVCGTDQSSISSQADRGSEGVISPSSRQP